MTIGMVIVEIERFTEIYTTSQKKKYINVFQALYDANECIVSDVVFFTPFESVRDFFLIF